MESKFIIRLKKKKMNFFFSKNLSNKLNSYGVVRTLVAIKTDVLQSRKTGEHVGCRSAFALKIEQTRNKKRRPKLE